MTHLLDSSAFFAFFFDEPGRQRVEELLREPAVEVGLSAMTSMTGKSRGFAFVTMSSVPEGNAAISALEGKNFDGRNLTVNEARPRDEGPKRSSSKSRW